MAKGSLSVFFAMVMVAVMTLIFTMSECIRVFEFHNLSQEYTDMAVESAFSEYNPYLWTNYRILAVDLGYGTDTIGPSILERKTMDYCSYNSNISEGKNYARLTPDSCRADKYTLLTDGQGQGVVRLGVKAAEDGLAQQIIDGVQGKSDSINGVEIVAVEELADSGDQALTQAKAELEEKKRIAAEDDNPDTNPSDYPEPGHVEDDPLDAFKAIRESFSKGVVSQVVSKDGLSEASIDEDTMPSHRSLHSGNQEIESGNAIVDKALFIDYLMTNYSYYGYDLKHDGLKYEVEYLISGKESDVESLARVVEELMVIREAANYTTIVNNSSLSSQAGAIAEILAGFTMNTAIIEAVKYAIIGAWAYIESILDIRLLLSGGKIPVVKNIDQWTSDVWHLSSVFDINTKAKACENGMSYKDYLIGFLTLHANTTLAMRACDVMENALNSTEDYRSVKVDNMVIAADISINYSGSEMFLSLLSAPSNETGYSFKKNKLIAY